MYKSSFCGVIEELPGVSVDNFERAEEVQARAYFLSHCHSDHTQGLFSDTLIEVLRKSGASIYMSEPTAAIIEDEANDKGIREFIVPLKLETITLTLPRDSQRNYEELYLTVTTIPAGHSFGAVMFLFQTKLKNILFTGDFRVSPNDLPKYEQLHNDNGPLNLDVVYLDTTFLSYRYLDFPKRSESVAAMIEEMKKWLRNENNGVALHTSAKYGYEFVYNEILKILGMKVYVDDSRWTLYSKLKHLVPGVTNEENTRIHICKNYSEKMDHAKCMTTVRANTNFLYIHFSAMKWRDFNVDDLTVNRVSDNRLDVCFATHCSRKELLFFVNYFSPKKVVGFPEKYSPSRDEDRQKKLVASPRKRKVAPNKDGGQRKVEKKVDADLLKKIFEF